MIEVRESDVFKAWFAGAARSGSARPNQAPYPSSGNPGDVKPVGTGVSEMRINYGPGYRVYFVGRGKTVMILLCGGDKRSQARDIARAIEMAQEI
jgi:putative addiction module killer protein